MLSKVLGLLLGSILKEGKNTVDCARVGTELGVLLVVTSEGLLLDVNDGWALSKLLDEGRTLGITDREMEGLALGDRVG